MSKIQVRPIICRGYNEASDSYKYRVVVRAVLVEVE